MEKPPGRTLCVGASYISLECAGFLNALGMNVTVMVRSILLRGFDQQLAEKIGEYMADQGVKFIKKATPVSITLNEKGQKVVRFKQD
jgi:thioredoxin reductase (NADPH)